MQTTIKSPIALDGVGLHSGKPVRIVLRPAAAETGVWFRRTDVIGRNQMISAHWSNAEPARLCTFLSNADGVSLSTVEHLMAAIAGCGLTNVLVEIDGPEVPILDGSAAPFVRAILSRGLRQQVAPVRALKVRETVEVRNGDAWARLEPSDGFEIAFEIVFPDPAIGRQTKRLDMRNGTFVRQLCDSRTFCRQADVDSMHRNGLALGGTLENSVVVDGARVLSPGGLRHADEPVRHKMLDAMGDLALAGAPLLARYTGFKAGHALTGALLKELFGRPSAAQLVELDEEQARRLPGVGVTRDELPLAA